jgi:hypothetical protein
VHRFLPFPTAAYEEGEIAIRSPLVLLEEKELDFYRTRTLALGEMRGRSVDQGGRDVGRLRDVVLDSSGALVAVVVEADGLTSRIAAEETLKVAPRRRTAA